MTASLSYDYTRRSYDHRPAQDEAGLYTARAIRMDTHTLAVALSYPLPKGFTLKTQGSYRRSTSNMLYEGTYRYNYYTAYYFAGVGWEL
ncbi:MAG: hypothetical protein A2506_03495 [Elusimicrobia bacterium RIFOXYD12_FULL_66_9]|nr:MAG: hypothetical protein A2506_03495 [Elusimicrobia bacterium RIFOXYD12_FULL_66_9]